MGDEGKRGDDNNIRVISRFRPLNSLEKEEGGKEVVTFAGETQVTCEPTEGGTGKDKHVFNFDRCFGPNCTQKEVYDCVGQSVVRDVFKGYNGTIFVYGQTGSGKSHTMMGPSSDDLRGYCDDEKMKGIIPRVVDQIFVNVEKADEHIEFTFKVSYVEIYMEKVRDLFDPAKANLQLHEDFKGGRGVFIADVTEEFVSDPDEIFALMRQGASNRAVASTRMNADSSRSHSIFQITIVQKHNVKCDTVTGKLFLVDLAGSEKVGKTGAKGQQLEEAKLINKSLSSLGLVINALTDRKTSHIPYRDSKLTRLLQESLGGNARTSLIICASVSEYNQQETLSTCRFGQRAKSIKNKAKVNRDLSIGEYKLLVARLERTIADLQKGTGVIVGGDAASAEVLANMEAQLESEKSRWQDEQTELKDELQEIREQSALKDQLLVEYRKELALYQEEVRVWEEEYGELQQKAEELTSAVERERKSNAERAQAIAGANTVIDQFAKDVLGVKVTLQKLRAHLEQQGVAAVGTLDDTQQQQVAAWRQDREKGRSDDAAYREELTQWIDKLKLHESDKDRQRETELKSLRGQLAQATTSCWLRYCVGDPAGDDAPLPEGEEALRAEVLALRKANTVLRQGDTMPRAAFVEAEGCFQKELQGREEEFKKQRSHFTLELQQAESLRASAQKDLLARCLRIIDLEESLDDMREQYRSLMVASSNKQLQKQLKLLQQQNQQLAVEVQDLANRNCTLDRDLQLSAKKLDIRMERIDSLKACLEDEKQRRHQEQEREATAKQRSTQQISRLQEEIKVLKDRLSAAPAAGLKHRHITKVVRGGTRPKEHEPSTPGGHGGAEPAEAEEAGDAAGGEN
eukprot:Hpha_TRINITY_DN9214_c0_g1::TRINITY_DN9214_c0_g1_i1::g.28466::m.28466/K10396/KIF5; kinesin family member 5